MVLGTAYRRQLSRRLVLILGGVSLIAVAYTGPWDNLIIANGVWSYGRGRVWGGLIGHVPLEEFCFYILQVILAGLIASVLLTRSDARPWGT
jgi:lycopene cyclase domain-containing protein